MLPILVVERLDFDTVGVYAAGDTTEDGKAVPATTVYTAMPYHAYKAKVNIAAAKKHGIYYMPNGKPLKQNSRAPHDAEANALRGKAQPAGWTWHHHKTIGRMDLIKSTVHAKFKHKGGFSLWGKK